MPKQSTITISMDAKKRRQIVDDKASARSKDTRDCGTDATSRRDVQPATQSSLQSPPPPPISLPKPPMDADFELPDSTDWLSTSLPVFEPLEAALRCEVCKEFLSNPVITTCSHTFCSICIRRCINAEPRCPSCNAQCTSDRLIPNIAVRDIVMRFQEARPKAIDLARARKEEEAQIANSRKRKLDETEHEDGEPVRQTRSRQTRGKSLRDNGTDNAPPEVGDSEDDGDADFVPEGVARCPVCNKGMKLELVDQHLNVCLQEQEKISSQGPSTRSRFGFVQDITHSSADNRRRAKTAFPKPLQTKRREPSPPPTRLSQLNYPIIKERDLRRKLQDIGIPNWGTKELLKRRHIEWLNIYNANCDAHESVRKSTRQLKKELEEWENTLGGNATSRESKIMKKDFDGNGYAQLHKDDFTDLIARARPKRATPRTDEVDHSKPEGHPAQNDAPQQTPESTVLNGTSEPQPHHQGHHESRLPHNEPHRSEINESPSFAELVHAVGEDETDSVDHVLPSRPSQCDGTGPSFAPLPDPLASSTQKGPKFIMSELPVEDLDNSTGVR
jgi:E3 ubiquitin-protein ligase RAD18